VRQEALDAARDSLRLTENQYKAGLIAYLDVVVVQATALNNEQSVLNVLQSRLLASVQLIAALGGGWDGQLQVSEEQ
jgi:outer membrane protein TolC